MTERPNVKLGLFAPSVRKVITQRGLIDDRWLAPAAAMEQEFIDNGVLVTVVRSQESDLAAVSSSPLAGLQTRMNQVLLLFIPIGLVCGLCLVAAAVYLVRSQLSMSMLLRWAIRHKELFIEYQPVVDLQSREWIGAEALVRWRRDGLVILPDIFVPMAEETGIIGLITKFVMAQVADDLQSILRLNPHFYISINLASSDLQEDATAERLKALLVSSGARPGNVLVEATERGVLQGAKPAEIVNKICSMGIDVAIDDFGTGYCNLSCLATLNLRYLKIDKSFVAALGTNYASRQVLLHVIEMARSLDLKMIAEGVETEEQARLLTERGVHFAQGWLFAKPMALDLLLLHIEEERNRYSGDLGARALESDVPLGGATSDLYPAPG